MKLNKYDTFIQSLFENQEQFLSATELITILCEKFGVNSNYARQLIRRATNDRKIIKSSAPFSFVKGQYFYMHPTQSTSLATLMEISKKYRKPLFRLLLLLKINEGIVSMYEAVKITATPVTNKEKYKTISLKEDLKKLSDLDFIIIKKYNETGEQFIILRSKEEISEHLIREHREKMNEDVLFIVDILRWFSKRGFITGAPLYRNKQNPSLGAIINDFLFDVSTFSQSTGFIIGSPNSNESKSIVVMDILLYRTYIDIDLHSYYDRIQSIRSSTSIGSYPRKVLPIVVYLDIEKETKRQLNNLHILNFSLEDLLGFKVRTVLENLQSLRQLIQDSYGLTEKDSITVIKTVQESLNYIEESGQNDNLQNIKGDLFETLLFTIFTSMFVRDNVEHSVLIKNPEEPQKQPYEYDLVIKRRKEIIIVELKGLKNTTIINLGSKDEKNTISWFFGKTYPIAKNHFVKNSALDKSTIKACYITSANFSDEALRKLDELNGSKIKSDILDTYYDRKKLLKLLKENEDLKDIRETTGFIKTLEKYYLTEE